jgi:hypothetical protein
MKKRKKFIYNGINLLYFNNNLCYLFKKKIKKKRFVLSNQIFKFLKIFFPFNINVEDFCFDFFLAKYNVMKNF